MVRIPSRTRNGAAHRVDGGQWHLQRQSDGGSCVLHTGAVLCAKPPAERSGSRCRGAHRIDEVDVTPEDPERQRQDHDVEELGQAHRFIGAWAAVEQSRGGVRAAPGTLRLRCLLLHSEAAVTTEDQDQDSKSGFGRAHCMHVVPGHYISLGFCTRAIQASSHSKSP